MHTQKDNDIFFEIKNQFLSLGKELTSSLEDGLLSLIKILQQSRDKKFVFLLVGRTGVGKSSTINALMGREVARVNPYEPETMMVESYDSEIDGVHFTVIDTPGLCDDIEDAGNDHQYLELIRSKAKQIDVMWFVSPLNDTRVRVDEKRGIKLISEAFGSEVWQRAVIIFTFADKVDTSDYTEALQKRTELIRKEIANHTGYEVANNIPSVAVANKCETTPDGKTWLEELYTKVFVRISEKGTIPFLLATAQRINNSGRNSKQSKKNQEKANQKNTYQCNEDPNWRFYNPIGNSSNGFRNFSESFRREDTKQQSTDDYEQNSDKKQQDNFNQQQREEIKNKLFTVVPMLKKIGGAIGSIFGGSVGKKIGQNIGGVVGHAIDFIGSLFG